MLRSYKAFLKLKNYIHKELLFFLLYKSSLDLFCTPTLYSREPFIFSKNVIITVHECRSFMIKGQYFCFWWALAEWLWLIIILSDVNETYLHRKEQIQHSRISPLTSSIVYFVKGQRSFCFFWAHVEWPEFVQSLHKNKENLTYFGPKILCLCTWNVSSVAI